MSEHIEQINLARARSALAHVRAARRPEWRADYLRAVEQFPFSARSLGLGQALALLAATGTKSNNGAKQLYADLHSWLCADEETRPYRDETDLLDALTKGDQATYRAALIEVEAYFAWLKPLAQALLGDAAIPSAAD